MIDMNRYKIILTPINSFYFGSTKHFGENNKNTYILESEQWPQQTAVLGMLRKEILTQRGLLYPIGTKEEISSLIGKKGFDFKDITQEFGCIKAITPILLETNDQKLYVQAPFDNAAREKNIYTPYKWNDKLILTYRHEEAKRVPVIKAKVGESNCYNPKEGIIEGLIEIDTAEVIEKSSYLKQVEQVGINRKQQENGLYKVKSYKFNNEDREYRFCFYTDIEGELEEKNSIVQLGASQSLFEMKIEKNTDEINYNTLMNHKTFKIEDTEFKRVWVISDTYLNKQQYTKVENGITRLKPFKYICNKVGERHFKLLEETYYLIERGSVLYCKAENEETLMDSIKSYSNLRLIGYNHVI